jgi:hypothetical protein
MTLDKMPGDEITRDEMTGDEITWSQNRSRRQSDGATEFFFL